MATIPVDYAITKIVALLENEVSLLGRTRYELHEIKQELMSMKSFLVDADNRRVSTESEKTWVENVRDIAYNVEDIIDEISYHMNWPQSDNKFTRFLQNTIQTPQNMWMRHCVGKKLIRINNKIKAISERRQRYGVTSIEGTHLQDEQKWGLNRGESSLFISGSELVGIEDDKKSLLKWLTDGEPQRKIVSVVGMGGSGKTSVVAQVYNNPGVKQHFESYAWISVSQTFVIEDLLKSMIKEFYQATRELITMDLSYMSYRQLVEILVNFLKSVRYLIVLDDVWHTNLWPEIQLSLPDGNCGSRILLTTRKRDIAFSSFGVRSHVLFIQPLQEEEAWILFCMKAFSSNQNKCCSPEIEALARDIVGKCGGLPLAIVALGGLMASKKLEIEWRRVCNSLNWELSNNPILETVKKVLLLSFHDLPYQLKQCFLYCSNFPEDHFIRRKRLVRLWMAEGFIEKIKGLAPEDVADSYLMELGHRSMLQVVLTPSGKPKGCKMHDLLRELSLSICEQQNFCQVYKGTEVVEEIRARRLSVQASDKKLESWASMSHLRSLFMFVIGAPSMSSLHSIPSGFRLLRVLEMEFVPIKILSEEIGNLFNLRYLNLKGTCIDELPKSIGRLRNLETLNLYQTKVRALPNGIARLHKLRYLIASYYNLELVDDFNYISWTKAPSGIAKLKNLRVLHFVEVKGNMCRYVRNLTQLTCLGILKAREVDGKALCSSIENMSLLCHLAIMVSKDDEVLHLDTISSTPPQLTRLNLVGMLEKVPLWFQSLRSLTTLSLSWSRLNEDPLPYIQSMPKLRRLTLINAYGGKKLHFLAGFLSLKSLILRNMPQLEEVVIEKGVMPEIQNLWHSKCMALKMLPQGIEHLSHLQHVFLANVSEELVERIRGEDSVDHPKVRHIPKISHYYQTSAEWLCESLS
ncbi:unnamed protein product [Dovyalis caffra]|uniref:Disease resistance protein RPM1-like n=1 Tax=Dovyalis caffra TaxID=77055 RepID=A0AAV1R536_9ROSI|nr:unnamed protein product [Dovyalis caffra]